MSATSTATRRDFLRTSTLGIAALGLTGSVHAATRCPRPQRDIDQPQARNLIFMVSDGMSTGTLTLADMFSRNKHGKPTNWVSLWNRPLVRRASAATYSADSWVTDSAAGGSAWGCGVHINNGAVNITPSGQQRVPLLVQARQSGKATALVTTTRVTHATPASFIANVPNRDMEKVIAQQILARSVDVVLGGGAHYFSSAMLEQHKDTQILRDRAALVSGKQAAPGEVGAKPVLLGLFHDQHVPYALDRDDKTPALSEMTKVALARVGPHEGGFVMQIEGGRVDHAAHNNDAGSLVAEQLDFDAAIGEVLSFIEHRDDTLVIITTDHGNANPGLTLYGEPGKKAFERLAGVRRSFDWIAEQFAAASAAGPLAGKLAEVVEAATGIGLDPKERELLAPMLSDHPPRTMPFAGANKWTSVLGALLADHLGVAFTSPNHTSDLVEVTALGPGSQRLAPMIENTDLHALVCDALDLVPPTPLPGMEKALVPVGKATDD
jgi:alkaline phosphatase